jgi:hypothetical protein
MYPSKPLRCTSPKFQEEHQQTAAALVEAAKTGNNTAAAAAEKKWYKNADEIAAFENSINPNWNKKGTNDHLA